MVLSHGIQIRPTAAVYDLVVLGAGPAVSPRPSMGPPSPGPAVVEAQAIGGQAGTSSMIRNYLGFHRGISGASWPIGLGSRATLLGAEFIFTKRQPSPARMCSSSAGPTPQARPLSTWQSTPPT